MKPTTLSQWIDYIQSLHARSIDLSLERVREVYQSLYPDGLKSRIISVAGTNGKGSTAELLTAIYHAAGYQVAKYTSPHLVSFNERFEINRELVEDHKLLASFERVEATRAKVPLTFFEFGTLIAIDLFATAKVDIMVMEVGLGGRLDAVNILDTDLAIVTNISKDHTAWLGHDLDEIAQEKVGIARAEKPLILSMSVAPDSLLPRAQQIGAEVIQRDRQFSAKQARDEQSWSWQAGVDLIEQLPLPFDQSDVQIDNAAGALMAVARLADQLPVEHGQIKKGLASARLAGRCQIIQHAPLIIFDVSHNVASLARLAVFTGEQLEQIDGRCVAVCGMLADKDISLSLSTMYDLVDEWFLASIHQERGASARDIQSLLPKQQSSHCFENIEDAFQAALAQLGQDDCLVVFGSFHIVGDIIKHLENDQNKPLTNLC